MTYNLYNHQKEIVKEDPKKTGLWLGTGSGKTRTALALAKGKTLVICPKTQRDDKNWEREVEEMGIDLDLTVISKETFRRDVDKLPRNFNTIIVDEAHTCLGVTPNEKWVNKQPVPKASQLFEALRKFTAVCKPERIYLVTATIMKSPFTVWAAGVILGKWTMLSFRKFRDRFYIELPMPGYIKVFAPKKDEFHKQRLAKLKNDLGYSGRLQDYFDVPDQTYHNEYIELTTEQKEAIKEVKLDYPEPIVQVGKRHQVENGVLKGDEYTEERTFKNNKIEKLIEYAYEFPKMIVFAKFTQQIEESKKALEEEGFEVYVMTGKTKDRGELLSSLKNKRKYIFIVQAQVSAGWELPECPVMIFLSRTYSWVDYSQAQGRILRANGLKKNLYVNIIVKNGVDEAVHKSLEVKQDFDEKSYAEKGSTIRTKV